MASMNRPLLGLNRQQVHIDRPANDLPMYAAHGVRISLPMGYDMWQRFA